MNLSGLGISVGRPLLVRVCLMTSAAIFSGAFSQWSKVLCQNTRPDVEERISADRPKVSATGTWAVIVAMVPLFSVVCIFARLEIRMFVHLPNHCVGVDISIL